MASYLITGASRGLGLALATSLAALPKSEVSVVFATSRQSQPPRLKELAEATSGRVVAIQLDPNEPDSLRAAIEQVEHHLQGQGLDVLINNSGVMPWTRGPIEHLDSLTETMHINVTLTHLVTRAFMPLLRQGRRKVVANISTTLGSITASHKYKHSPCHAYKISKAALNMLTVQYSIDYADEGFIFFAVTPGWLKTDLGGSNADLPVETGANEVMRLVLSAGPETNGRFINIHVPGWEDKPGPNQYDGKEVPW